MVSSSGSLLPLLMLLPFLTSSAPSSPWNQAGLNLIFKPDLNRQTNFLLANQTQHNNNHAYTHHAPLKLTHSAKNTLDTPSVHTSDLHPPPAASPTNHSNALEKRPAVKGRSRTGSHSWGYTRYGQDIGHIRHTAHRKLLLPSNRIVPCPRDYIQTYNGKCRRIPKFSPSRVG